MRLPLLSQPLILGVAAHLVPLDLGLTSAALVLSSLSHLVLGWGSRQLSYLSHAPPTRVPVLGLRKLKFTFPPELLRNLFTSESK